MICANIDIIRRIKCVIDEIVTDGSSNISNNIAQLKDALTSIGSESEGGGLWNSNAATSADIVLLRAKLADEVECKIMTVRGLEAIINEQNDHHTILQNEIHQLQQVVTTMEIQKSNQEDEIETLKARIVKLEVGVQMQDSTIASLQEAIDIQAKCNDITNNNLEVEYEKRIHEYKSYYKREEEQINMLRARIMSWKKSDVMLERKYKKRRNLHLWSRNIFEKECRNSK
jgi:chromosome segregation ATPase